MASAPSLADRVRRKLRRHVAEPFEERVRAPLRARRNADRIYDPVFVAGASGSGTSMLALSIGQRFDCAGVIYETNFQVARDSFLYVPPIEEFATVGAYQKYMTPTDSWSEDAARDALQHCYRRYCSGPSRVVVDKGPDINLLRAAFLHRCFPEARFVTIFRDPVANVEGLRRKWKPFANEPLQATIRFWADIHEAYLSAAESMPDRIHAIEYEAVVADPDAVLKLLGERLGLAPAQRRVSLASSPNVEGQGIRNVRAGKIGYVDDANQRARARLTSEQVKEIEAALGDLAARLRNAPFTITRADLGG